MSSSPLSALDDFAAAAPGAAASLAQSAFQAFWGELQRVGDWAQSSIDLRQGSFVLELSPGEAPDDAWAA